jgi:MSHA biogenesis protein MshQ
MPTLTPTLAPTEQPTADPTTQADPNNPSATCLTSGTTYSTPTGTVSDGDGSYSNSQACSWTISTGSAITLSFSQFNTETYYDYVKVYDGTNTILLATLDGNSVPSAVTAPSGIMVVEFSSDGSVVRDGFMATWQSNPPHC